MLALQRRPAPPLPPASGRGVSTSEMGRKRYCSALDVVFAGSRHSAKVLADHQHLAGVLAVDDQMNGGVPELVAEAGDYGGAVRVVVERDRFLVGPAVAVNHPCDELHEV